MTDYDDTNRGAIWTNNRKRPDKKDPDYTGKINIEGHQFYIDAWKPTSDHPKAPFLSIRVKRADSVHPVDYDTSRPAPAASQEKPATGESGPVDDGFDEIPF